ncbi:MAG: hypothetical protein VW338_12600 [Rhodospirillaceae bacterium]
MRACRNRRYPALAAVATVLAVATAGPAVAQQPSPLQPAAEQPALVKLAPPTRLKPAAPDAGAQPSTPKQAVVAQPDYKAGPGGQSVTTLTSVGASGIQVDRLQVVTPDSAGILTTENGGFGVDMWRGANMAAAMEMLARVPALIGSPTLAGLVRRLVLTPATPPEGPSDGEQLAVKRLGLLTAMADYSAALDLLSVMPRQGRGPGLLRAEAELRFLTGDNIAGCGLAAGEIKRNPADFWQKALVYCQLLSDQREKAELGLSMLREIGNDDPLFFRLSDAMSGAKTVQLADAARPTPLATAMLAHVTLEATPQGLVELAPGAARALALNTKLAPQVRLVAAERAAMLGVLGDGAHRKLVLKIAEQLPPAADGAAAPPEGAASAVERARLYAAAKRAGLPAAKAEAASRALRSALADGVYRATVRLFRDEMAVVPASTENTWLAADAIRAAAANGAIEQARSWLLLLKRSALLSPETADMLTGLQALARVIGEAGANTDDKPLRAADARRTVLARAILAGLGEPTTAAEWLTFADPLVDGVAQAPMPAPALWFAFRAMNEGAKGPDAAMLSGAAPTATQIAEAGVVVRALDAPTPGARSDLDNKAARVLVMARLVGQGQPAELNPIVLAEVIRALKVMGLDAEARAFALEAALGAGL